MGLPLPFTTATRYMSAFSLCVQVVLSQLTSAGPPTSSLALLGPVSTPVAVPPFSNSSIIRPVTTTETSPLTGCGIAGKPQKIYEWATEHVVLVHTDATVVPYITPFMNGTNVTSYSTMYANSTAPTVETPSTTVVSGFTMTSPTAYIDYNQGYIFASTDRAQWTTENRYDCVRQLTPLSLPGSVEPTRLIAPYSTRDLLPITVPTNLRKRLNGFNPAVDGTYVPDDILDYLMEIGMVKEQFPGLNLRTCSSAHACPTDYNDKVNNVVVEVKITASSLTTTRVTQDPVVLPTVTTHPQVGPLTRVLSPAETHTPNSPSSSLVGEPLSATAATVPTTIPGVGVVTLNPSTPEIILPDGATLLPGNLATISGIAISLDGSKSALIIATSTLPLNSPQPIASAHVPNDVHILPSGEGAVLPNGVTLSPESGTVVDGVSYSLAAAATMVVIDDSTIAIPQASEILAPISILPSSEGIILPNHDILKPGSATELGGTTYSLDPQATVLYVESDSFPASAQAVSTGGLVFLPGLALLPGSVPTINSLVTPSATRAGLGADATASSSLTYPAGLRVLPQNQGLVLPNDQILLPGSATVVSGTFYSVAVSETAFVVGSSTYPITTTPADSPSSVPTQFSLLPAEQGIFLPNGEILQPGSATTISGIFYSLEPSEIALVVGSSTIPLEYSMTMHPGSSAVASGTLAKTTVISRSPSRTATGRAAETGGAMSSREQICKSFGLLILAFCGFFFFL